MEHACSKCGATVQDGTPFCWNCGAPQIRVANPFGDTPVTPPMPPGTPGEVQPPAEVPPPWSSQQQSGFRSPSQFNWRAGWRTAITVGVVIGILSVVPLVGALCCLWMVGGGAIAVLHYRRSADQPFVSLSLGFRLGMLTGLVGFLVNAVGGVSRLIAGGSAAQQAVLREAITKSMARNSDPQAAAMIQRMGEWMQSPQGFAVMFTLGMLMVGIAFILLTGLGGLMGSSLFGKKSNYS